MATVHAVTAQEAQAVQDVLVAFAQLEPGKKLTLTITPTGVPGTFEFSATTGPVEDEAEIEASRLKALLDEMVARITAVRGGGGG